MSETVNKENSKTTTINKFLQPTTLFSKAHYSSKTNVPQDKEMNTQLMIRPQKQVVHFQ